MVACKNHPRGTSISLVSGIPPNVAEIPAFR
jgi:hypothetical protein